MNDESYEPYELRSTESVLRYERDDLNARLAALEQKIADAAAREADLRAERNALRDSLSAWVDAQRTWAVNFDGDDEPGMSKVESDLLAAELQLLKTYAAAVTHE